MYPLSKTIQVKAVRKCNLSVNEVHRHNRLILNYSVDRVIAEKKAFHNTVNFSNDFHLPFLQRIYYL